MKLNQFEKQFQRLQNHGSDELDQNKLWLAVEDRLDSEKKKRRFIPVVWWGAGILVFGVLFAAVIHSAQSQKVHTNELPVQLSEEAPSASANHKKERVKEEQKTIGKDNAGIVTNSVDLESDQIKSSTIASKDKSVQESVSLLPSAHIEAPSNSKPTALSIPSRTTELEVQNNEETSISAQVRGSNTLESLPQLDIKLPSFTGLFPEMLSLNKPQEKSGISKTEWLLGLEAGAVYPTLGIQSEGAYATQRIKTESPEPGWQIGVNVLQVKPSGLTLGTGLAYQKAWTKFVFKEERTGEVLLENELVEILIDQATMDTIGRRYGEVGLDTSRTRNVQHFNERTTIGFPLYFGIMKTGRNITFGITGMLRYDYALRQRGRLLDAGGKIIDLKEGSYFKRSTASMHISPWVVIDLKGGFGLSLKPSIGWTMNDQKAMHADFKQRPVEYSCSLGIVKRLIKK